jgi:CTP:molybdopterin cytidylyltransferase MocA
VTGRPDPRGAAAQDARAEGSVAERAAQQRPGVGGIVLAAGAGRRLGGPKALVQLGRQSLAARAVLTLRDGGCAPVVVVLGAAAERVRAEGALPSGAEVVENPDWATGMGSSLRVGLAALEDRCRAVVVALADQPLVSAAAVGRLVRAWQGGARAAVATYDGAPRNPVLLDASLWPVVAAQATGDRGAGPFLRAHPEVVTAVPCEDVAAPDDVDTPADLAAVTAALTRRREA